MNSRDERLSVDLLDRYLADDITRQERQRVEAWLAADPSRALSSIAGAAEPSPRARAALARLLDGAASAVPGQASVDATVRRPRGGERISGLFARSRGPSRLVVGAAIAVCAVTLVVLGHLSPSSRTPVVTRDYVVAPGHQAAVTLDDGTRVWLAAASRLHVVMGETRELTLDGEALFSVAHASSRPFVVRTHGAAVQVLGTTFLYRQYGAEAPRVVVADGRVSMRGAASNASPAILTARMLGTITDSGRITVTPNVAIDDYTALSTGRLVFRRAPIHDVIAELDRAYAVDIQLGDSTFAHEQLTLTVPVESRSLDQVLRVLAVALDAHYTRSGSTITIVPGHVSPRDRRTPLTEDHQYGR